jgi:hypothetical protein
MSYGMPLLGEIYVIFVQFQAASHAEHNQIGSGSNMIVNTHFV